MKYISKKEILFPKRGQKKGDNGKLLIVGGSKEYVGAVALAGIAALRTGTDWVTCACPEKVAWTINSLSPDLVTTKLKGEYLNIKHKNKIIDLSLNHNTILIGNGIGLKSKDLVNAIVKLNIPKVIDADGIKLISLKEINNAIITPHKKEFEILLKNSKIDEKELKEHIKDNIIILKGRIDTIISKDKILYNKTGNPGMTKAGTGDVLAGLVAGFLSQRLTPLQSSINATYINGFIGDLLLKKKKGYFYIASDLVNEMKKWHLMKKQLSIS